MTTPLIGFDDSNGNLTFNLASVADHYGKSFVLHRFGTSSGSTVTIDADGSETISGSLTKTLATTKSITLYASQATGEWIVTSQPYYIYVINTKRG